MDSEDVTLDWGANEDDEVLAPTGTKDAATISGAESLLALASASEKADKQEENGNLINEDKDSDAVSLGGENDDMDELYAYQSRARLGGKTAAEVPVTKKQTRQEATAGTLSLSERPHSPPPSAVSASVSPAPTIQPDNKINASSSNAIIPNDYIPNSKKPEGSVSRSKSRSASISESAHPSPLAGTLPPPGTHGLPPKPVAAALNTPYVRPSHPSIMSASTMAPQRDHDREHRRHASPKRGRRQYSPDSDLPLAPGWEVRVSRDGSNDQYYYNPQTDQSTWDRRVAAGLVPLSPKPPYYSRDSTGRHSPDTDNIKRGRSSRHEQSSGRAVSPRLSYSDRHYSPPKGDHHSGPSRSDRGNSQRYQQRAPSPEHLSPYVGSRRGNDRDIAGYSYRTRPHGDRPLHEEGPLGRRDGEIVAERARPPSPGRERYGSIRSNTIREREPTRMTSKELRPDFAAAPYEDRDKKDRTGLSPRFRTVVPPPTGPQLSSSAQFKRDNSPPRDDRYMAPGRDTFRARNPSPQGPAHHRPSKRMRSPVSPARHADPPSFSQPLPPQWAAHSDAKKTRHDVGGVRDKPPHISEPPILIPSAKYMEREEGQRHELQKGHDIKRQKTTVDLDSASTRRRPAPDEINSRDIRENAPLGPRRRDSQPLRREMDSYRPEPPPDMRARTDTYPERPPRGPDRDRESSRLDLPTGPRAMDFSTTESAYSHRESRRGFPRPLPDGPFPNDGGSGYRGGDQHPVTEDDRFRQRDHDRRENGPRNRGENRYTPSAHSSRYDAPHSVRPDSSTPSGPNNIPLKPRFGDFYRPDEHSTRNRSSPRDAKRANPLRKSSLEERRVSSEIFQIHSSVAHQSDTYSKDAKPTDLGTERDDSRTLPSNLGLRDAEAHSPSISLPEVQERVAREESHVAVTGDADAMMVDDTPKADTSAAPANDASVGNMDIDVKSLTYPPSPPALGNKRKRSSKFSDIPQLEQSNGDTPSRPIHGLPPKPNVRAGSSLIDRLSNPEPTNSKQTTTSLRDRVAREPPAPGKPHSTSTNARPSLRDRLDSHSDAVERNGEDHRQRSGHHANNNWRNNRSRRGRGQ